MAITENNFTKMIIKINIVDYYEKLIARSPASLKEKIYNPEP